MLNDFSLFNFDWIEKFEHYGKHVYAAAAASIPLTTLYECPEGRIALIFNISVMSYKITSTAFKLSVYRKPTNLYPGVPSIIEPLLLETLGSTEDWLNWPMAKASSQGTLGATPLFLFQGDTIKFEHAGTAAEAITDFVAMTFIQYKDPRYHDKLRTR